jgi:hypothetical protein
MSPRIRFVSLSLALGVSLGQGVACSPGTSTEGGTGGVLASGGSNGSAAAPAAGGQPGSGGGDGAGGAPSGGAPATGGQSEAGGSSDSGGTEASGGSPSTGGGDGSGGNSFESEMLVFLLIGQSNMVGQPQPEAQDEEEDPRIKVLAYDNCDNVGRTYNEWYTASPPLHQCDAGVGPGDYFAKTLLSKLPATATIGLVPFGVNGAPLDVIRKGIPRPGWTLPPDDHWDTGYEWILSRATLAQEVGTIRGILFHQGESDATNAEWAAQVAQLVADLRADLGIGEEAPFIAGEFLATGCCADRNPLVNGFIEEIPNAWVASSSGLAGTDTYHFDLAGQRELGKRYGEQMISALGLE